VQAVALRWETAVGVRRSTRCCAGMAMRRTGEEPAARERTRLSFRSGREAGREEDCLLLSEASPELSMISR
jgi:hypothetical protein